MWTPRTLDDLRAGLVGIQETAQLELKSDLPKPTKNVDLAVDVAAMSTDGGTIIYGIEEDKAAGIFNEHPIPTAGAVERITQIVQSQIGGAPEIEAFVIDAGRGDGRGFIVVAVPASPLAPHMVHVKGVMRFYGRDPGGNRPIELTQGEVDRLYARRRQWETDVGQLFEEAFQSWPLEYQARTGRALIVVRPLLSDSALRAEAGVGDDAQNLWRVIRSASTPAFTDPRDPLLDRLVGGHVVPLQTGIAVDLVPAATPAEPRYRQRLEIHDNGLVRLLLGAATERVNLPQVGREMVLIRERTIAQLTGQVFRLAGSLLAAGGYHGSVDVGFAVVDAPSDSASEELARVVLPIAQPLTLGSDYRQTKRLPAAKLLEDPIGTARDITRPLMRVLRPAGAPDPLA